MIFHLQSVTSAVHIGNKFLYLHSGAKEMSNKLTFFCHGDEPEMQKMRKCKILGRLQRGGRDLPI